MELISQFLTHLVAFGLLFWLLKKYAWTAILQRIDSRRDRIESQFAKIDQARQEIEGLKRDYSERLSAIEEEARRKLQEAVSEGQRVALEVQQEARDEARVILEKAKANIDLELAKARVELRNQVVDLAIDTAERLLSAKMDDQQSRRLAEEFVQQMEKAA